MTQYRKSEFLKDLICFRHELVQLALSGTMSPEFTLEHLFDRLERSK
ncbi:hypothetical protein [Roseobacter sp.]